MTIAVDLGRKATTTTTTTTDISMPQNVFDKFFDSFVVTNFKTNS